MSEKPNIKELAQQINSLSKEEKAELVKRLDIKEMISLLYQREREKLFYSLNIFWHHEDYEGKALHQTRLCEAFQVNPDTKFITTNLISCLVECKAYTTDDFNSETQEIFLTFEHRFNPYANDELNYVPISPFPSEQRFTYIEDYIRKLFTHDIPELAEDMSEKVLIKLSHDNPKVMEWVDRSNYYKKRARKGLHKLAQNTHKEETLKRFARLANSYEEDLKNFKKELKTIYNSLDRRLPNKDREEQAKQIFLQKHLDLMPDTASVVSLHFSVAEEAKILAAKDCCLNPFTREGKFNNDVKNWYTEGKKLLNEEEQAYNDSGNEQENGTQ